MVVMLCGILTLALPIGVLGTTFTSLWLEHKDRQAKPTLPLPPLLKALDDTLTQHVASVGEFDILQNRHTRSDIERHAGVLKLG